MLLIVNESKKHASDISKEYWTSDVTKMATNANFDFQNLSNANANTGIHFISQNVMHWFRSIK